MIAPSYRLGPYEIISRIGAGGMGEVWRARDTRIGRDVAIKFLPPELTANAERLRRFEQEARSAGTLNHQNLITIHELGSDGGAPYIVMELLEGETLRERMGDDSSSASGPRMPIRKAIDLSVQIANGLAAAHDKGIVHRDLKPENIMVTPDGHVKILDFGLAKLTVADSDDSRTQQRETSPGTVVGTPGYMSPEQVRGQDVDHRTDVFAFGAILYEMLTGRRAFRRSSSVETMNAILHDDPPDASSSAQHISPAVDRIVRRCLEKSRGERFQSARDLGFALDALGASSGSNSHSAVSAAPKVGNKAARLAIPAFVAALLLVALGAAYSLGRRTAVSAPAPRFTQLTFASGSEKSPAIAPNGETFVFVRDGDIYLKRVDGRNAINLTKSPDTEEAAPAFSPDGRQIAFHTARGIFVMGATGESVRRITSVGFDPAWSPDGTKITFTRDEPTVDPRSRNTSDNPLMIVPAAGGAPKILLAADAMQARWSPDGRRIAYWGADNAGRRDIYTVAADGAKESIVAVTNDTALDWSPAWSPDGKWLYFASDRNGTMSIWRVAIDSTSGRSRGEPQMVSAPAASVGWLSMASDGRSLCFETTAKTNSLVTARVDAMTEAVTLSDKPVLDGSLQIRLASISPDASTIAFTTDGQEDLFVMRSDGSELRQLTNDIDRDRGPSWSSNGEQIVFYSSRSGNYQIWAIRPDGSELRQLSNVVAAHLPFFPLLSPGGKQLAATTSTGAWIADLTKLPITKVDTLPLLKEPRNVIFHPQGWSPDGTRLAGPSWNEPDGIYIYNVAGRSYTKVAPGFESAIWLDDQRLIVGMPGKLALLDVRSMKLRQLWSGDLELAGRAFTGGNLVMASRRVERDVWLASLPEE